MRYRVIDLNTGKKYKCKQGEMLTVNPDGQAFLVSGLEDYYTYITRLSNVVAEYVIEYAFEKDANGRWVYQNCVVND